MRRTSFLVLLLSSLAAGACDEPDEWEAKSNPSGGKDPGGTGGGIVIVGSNRVTLGGFVNAPVAPEAVYLGLGGASPGVSVLDLNGFGQGTGDILNTRFPFNPNIGLPGVVPPLSPGTSNLDAGSAGALTLTQDSIGNTRLLDDRFVGEVTDMQLGQPLDLVFNNANINPNASAANQVNPVTGVVMTGNTIMVAPHPNPPRLVFPAPNPAMGIQGEEPTVASSQGFGLSYPFTPFGPPCLVSPLNLLVPGDPFSSQAGVVGIFGASFPGVFYGPQPAPPNPPPPPAFCPYVSRQQVGHFLYVLDRANSQIVVVNSNRFRIEAMIAMPDPTDIAMAPNLEVLAVSNSTTGDVRFIDTDPTSATFHQVVAQTQVSQGITGMAWQPEGEDLLVLNPRNDSMALVDGLAFQVRRIVTRALREPIGVAVSARQTTFGFQTGVWYAYVLNGDGTIAVFESGPSGMNGIGYDDMLGRLGPVFANARSVHADAGLGAAFWVTHADDQGLGQVSLVELVQAPVGPQPPLPVQVAGDGTELPFRGKQWLVTRRYGGSNPTTPVAVLLSGNAPVDLAFDDIVNNGAWPDQVSPVVPGLTYANHSGKGLVKIANGVAAAARSPQLMFVALGDTGTVDVIDLATGNQMATAAAPGIGALCDYWRQ